MEISRNTIKALTLISVILLGCSLGSAHCHGHKAFLNCLQEKSQNDSNSSLANLVHTKGSSSYRSILENPIKNLRFSSSTTPRPVLIITPSQESQIQAIVICSKAKNMQIRIRSGGHDYEGLSYTSHVPFIVLDLTKMSKITINRSEKTAWVQTGATIGQLYYKISQESPNLAFPAGTCPTVGVGGHFSGGGYGTLMRKYGLSADNIIDARIIDFRGKIMNRKSMGEDLFWAIRGGGGASFGIITAWKVRLVSVPETLTVFHVRRTLEQNASKIFHRWQFIAPYLPKDLFLSLDVRSTNVSVLPNGSNKKTKKTIVATFNSLYLGGAHELIEILDEKFPELGVTRQDCYEVGWAQSLLSFSGYSIENSTEVLNSRVPLYKVMYFKAKSDFVQEPIPEDALDGIWRLLYEKAAENALMIFTPYGGEMSDISQFSVPFPHRLGNLYMIQHLVYWDKPGEGSSKRHVKWIRKLYHYMAPYVSKNPRAAYVNYRDLDLGVNDVIRGNSSFAKARVWGLKYFKNNFDRLARVKTEVDPGNFFRNEQSIPVI